MYYFSNNSKKKQKKILTKYVFHWLELITKVLSFLQIHNVRKTNSFFNISETVRMSIKNYIPGIFWAYKRKLQIVHATNYIALFLPDSSNCFFHMFSAIYPYMSLLFSHCVFIFTFFFILFSPRDILQLTMFDSILL